jgi:DNA-binding response OmpR family regulator
LTPNNVTVTIRRLRMKLGSRLEINTAFGEGYYITRHDAAAFTEWMREQGVLP